MRKRAENNEEFVLHWLRLDRDHPDLRLHMQPMMRRVTSYHNESVNVASYFQIGLVVKKFLHLKIFDGALACKVLARRR